MKIENVVLYEKINGNKNSSLLPLTPFVLLADLFLLTGSEVILNVKCLPDLLGSLPFDHIGNSLVGDIQQALEYKMDKKSAL